MYAWQLFYSLTLYQAWKVAVRAGLDVEEIKDVMFEATCYLEKQEMHHIEEIIERDALGIKSLN